MFSDRSRYKSLPVDTVTTADGRSVSAVRFPARNTPTLLGYHRRSVEQRLDHIANFYLKDPVAFWLLCDANGARSPHALTAHDLIGIPVKER